jgi:cation diffusion facilitator family transporter
MAARLEPAGRFADIQRVLVVTLALNWLVAIAKLLVGYLTHTLSMVADGYHSLIDGSSNVIGLVAIHFAAKPPDADHQYGHHKYETVSATAIGVALFAAAWRIGSDALERTTSDTVVPRVGVVNFAVMALTLAVNLAVSAYERRAGERLRSPLLLSDAAHTRSDVFASSTVIVALVATWLGYPWIDVLASLAIAVIIVAIGWRIVRGGVQVMADQMAIDPDRISALVLAVEGVEGCDRIRSRGTEAHVFVDLTCYVSADMTMSRAHELADRIEARIHAAFPQVEDTVVHLEPARPLPPGAAAPGSA